MDEDREEVVDYTVFSIGRTRYDDVVETALDIQRQLLGSNNRQYIWYRESFSLNKFSFEGIPCLFGSTDFGGCIEDEWVIVWLLKELSKVHRDLYIRVADTDGEFLMIEAAKQIPKWITPEVAENRVWINNGGIAIIPEDAFHGECPSIEDAFDYLKEFSKQLVRIEAVNNEAFDRIADFPHAAIRDNTHRAKVIVPAKVAGILHRFPQYISGVVDSLLSRDASATTKCRQMKVFGKPESQVETVVRFTRRQYAMILPDQFRAPWRFGTADDPESKEAQLGEKVTCGLELLADESIGKTPLTKDTVRKLRDYKDIIADLTERGYFMGNEPGTEQYNILIKQTVQPFIDARRIANENAYLVVRIRQQEPDQAEIDGWESVVDDEAWLVPEEKEDVPETVQEMLEKLKEFMSDQKAGLDGLNFDDEDESESSDDSDGEEKIDASDPVIDEDDFLEYFLQEGLKLGPDEIAKYQSEPKTGSNNEEWEQIEHELRTNNALQDDETSQEALLSLLQMARNDPSGAPATGPAAVLLEQLRNNNNKTSQP